MGTGKKREYGRGVRLQAVEAMLHNGLRCKQIAEVLCPRFGIKPRTIQKDLEDIRRAWRETGDDIKPIASRRGEYLARLHQDRKLAMDGFVDSTQNPQKRFRALRLVFDIDKELARVTGTVPVEEEGDGREHTLRVVFEPDPAGAGDGE